MWINYCTNLVKGSSVVKFSTNKRFNMLDANFLTGFDQNFN